MIARGWIREKARHDRGALLGIVCPFAWVNRIIQTGRRGLLARRGEAIERKRTGIIVERISAPSSGSSVATDFPRTVGAPLLSRRSTEAEKDTRNRAAFPGHSTERISSSGRRGVGRCRAGSGRAGKGQAICRGLLITSLRPSVSCCPDGGSCAVAEGRRGDSGS